MASSRRSLRSSGSPPDMMTSRISVCSSRYWNADSNCDIGIFSGSPDLPPPGAEAAVGGADRGDQEERPVGIAVRDVRHRAVRVLVERVDDAVDHLELVDRRHVLAPDRVVRLLDEVHHCGRDAELEVLRRDAQPVELGEILRAELDGERFEGSDRVLSQDFLPGLHAGTRPPKADTAALEILHVDDLIVSRGVEVRDLRDWA